MGKTVLSRKPEQAVVIITADGPIKVYGRRKGAGVALAIEAPKEVRIVREELLDQPAGRDARAA
jgi:sRNA-binding carbon storage regulator CsrA